MGWNVKTNDWIFVMVNSWSHDNPQFQLVDQDIYTKDYLWITDPWTANEGTMEKHLIDKLKKQYGLWEDTKLSESEQAKQQPIYDDHIKEYKAQMNAWVTKINSADGASSWNTNTTPTPTPSTTATIPADSTPIDPSSASTP